MSGGRLFGRRMAATALEGRSGHGRIETRGGPGGKGGSQKPEYHLHLIGNTSAKTYATAPVSTCLEVAEMDPKLQIGFLDGSRALPPWRIV